MNFSELNIDKKIIENVTRIGYATLTKIQEMIIPILLKNNDDIFACAQTGTGKTAAYALPIIDRLRKHTNENGKTKKPQCLVVAPTRELAIQIHHSFLSFSSQMNINIGLYYGGIKIKQQLSENHPDNDIVVATPGRLLELHKCHLIDLSQIKTLIVDEADHMLDMGFIDDLDKIIALLPKQKQVLLFSATLSGDIKKFVEKKMHLAKFINANEPNSVNLLINQSAVLVRTHDRLPALVILVKKMVGKKILIFTQTKKDANFLGKLFNHFEIKSNTIHSDKNQKLRQKIIEKFKNNSLGILIATDVIARGMHIENIDLVINYRLPKNPEAYIHRIGRTGRLGNNGKSISFYTKNEQDLLINIEKIMKKKVNRQNDLFDQSELKIEKERLQTFLVNAPAPKKNFLFPKKHAKNVSSFKENDDKKRHLHSSQGNRVRFALHNHLRNNLKRQHQIYASTKKINSDNW